MSLNGLKSCHKHHEQGICPHQPARLGQGGLRRDIRDVAEGQRIGAARIPFFDPPRGLWVRGGDGVGGASSLRTSCVYPPVERWSLWDQSWNYETKFVPLNNGEVIR